MANVALYSKGEAILAHHGPMIYPAKVMATREKGAEFEYKVHYLGAQLVAAAVFHLMPVTRVRS